MTRIITWQTYFSKTMAIIEDDETRAHGSTNQIHPAKDPKRFSHLDDAENTMVVRPWTIEPI